MHNSRAKGILSSQNGMNLCRGCLHGCIYCDARSKCYHIEHDFEDIELKVNAPELLEAALKKKRKKCMIGTGAMSDPYLPLPEALALTRKCLEIIRDYSFGLAIQTKSDLILKDMELLKQINGQSKCVVEMTLTTYDENLCRILEPNVCTTKERFRVLETMRDNNIPTVVWLSPILPFINDTEENLRGILQYCIDAGVHGIICFDMGVTLREGDREFYYQNLDRHFPGMKERYQKKYGLAYEVTSEHNAELMKIFYRECRKHNILCRPDEVFSYLHTYEDKMEQAQLSLFDWDK